MTDEQKYESEDRTTAQAAEGTEAGSANPAAQAGATNLEDGAAAQAAPAPGGDAEGAPATDAEGVELDPLAQAEERAADLQDQLARRNADMYNLQEEYNRYVRRSKAEVADHRNAGVQTVAEALMPVLDDLALAREHGDLSEGPLAAIADKLENTLKGQFGIERYGAAGEEFNPMVHEALTNMASPDVEVATVAHVIQPGYRFGERILRAARVAVQSPE